MSDILRHEHLVDGFIDQHNEGDVRLYFFTSSNSIPHTPYFNDGLHPRFVEGLVMYLATILMT